MFSLDLKQAYDTYFSANEQKKKVEEKNFVRIGPDPAQVEKNRKFLLTRVQHKAPVQGGEVEVAARTLHPLAPYLFEALAALVHRDYLHLANKSAEHAGKRIHTQDRS